MTSRDLLALVLRRWYLMALGALISLGVLYEATHEPPVFFTQYSVVLLPPRSTTFPNNLEDPHYGMTPMAGVIVSDYNAGHRLTLLGSPDTTLYGEGVRDGSRVRLPNDGSQWQPIYDLPNIDVQVVGPSPEEVTAKARQIGDELEALLKRRQDQLGIRDTMRMTALISSPDPIIAQVGGARSRTALGVVLAGATLTTIGVVRFDRWWARRRTRRRTDPGPGALAASEREPVLVD